MKIFTILEHHEKGSDMGGDYYDIEILDENEEVIQTYGDAYHDSGNNKAEGFIDGARYATKEVIKIEYKNVADREY